MSNYKETAVAGTKWTRCGVVQIVNPYQRNPSIQFIEERAVSLGEGREPLFFSEGSISVPFDENKVVNLINPLTGQPTGATVTYGELYVGLFSAYIQAALERDMASVSNVNSEQNGPNEPDPV